MSAGEGAHRITGRRFLVGTLAIVLVGLVVRVVYAFARGDERLGLDGNFYHETAALLADGRGFIEQSYFKVSGIELPGASHPPGYSVVLALFHLVGLDSVRSDQLVSCLLGALGVVAMAYAARRFAGPLAGWVAAALTALHPIIWINDAMVMSESLAVPVTGLLLLAAYRFLDRPGWSRAVAVGVLLGAGVLVRPEAALLVPILGIWMALVAASAGWGRRLLYASAVVAVAALVVAPWVLPNLSRFERPVLLTTSTGDGLVGANCPQAYSGENIGAWNFLCTASPPAPDASVRDERNRRRAARYALDHIDRWPIVSVARVGRTLGVWNPPSALTWEEQVEFRSRSVQLAGLVVFWVLVPFAVVGALDARRRGRSLVPPLALIAATVVASVLFYGQQRFRLSADLAVILLASGAIARLLAPHLPPPLERWVSTTGQSARLRPNARGSEDETPSPAT